MNPHQKLNIAYRYGFQGQESDDEVKGEGNSVNYKYRMHDPRVGRFFAVDPLTSQFAHISPYSFSENRVINSIELEGAEAKTIIYIYDPQTGHYPVNPNKIIDNSWMLLSSGEAYRFEGGPDIPKGFDYRLVLYNDDGEIVHDRYVKKASSIWRDATPKVKIEMKTEAKVEVEVKRKVINANAKVSAQVGSVTATVSKNGVEVDTEGPKGSYQVGGGAYGVTMNYGEDTQGTESTSIEFGPIILSGNRNDNDASKASQSIMAVFEIDKVDLAPGISSTLMISFGFEHDGPTSIPVNNK